MHEAKRLKTYQNTPIAVLMVIHTRTHAHTRTCFKVALDVQSSIMDVVVSNDALYEIQLCGSRTAAIKPLNYH